MACLRPCACDNGPMKPIDERTFTFVIKIWWERRDIAGVAPTWRGSVEDIQTGQRVYFQSSAALCRYLEHRSYVPVTPPRLLDRLIMRFRRK